jgi:hypothetical protein
VQRAQFLLGHLPALEQVPEVAHHARPFRRVVSFSWSPTPRRGTRVAAESAPHADEGACDGFGGTSGQAPWPSPRVSEWRPEGTCGRAEAPPLVVIMRERSRRFRAVWQRPASCAGRPHGPRPERLPSRRWCA